MHQVLRPKNTVIGRKPLIAGSNPAIYRNINVGKRSKPGVNERIQHLPYLIFVAESRELS